MPSTFGWDPGRQPTDWSYSVAFKKPRSGKLLWVDSGTKDEHAASKIARALVAVRHGGEGYQEYGISKSYWRIWGENRSTEPITRKEYEAGQRRMAEGNATRP